MKRGKHVFFGRRASCSACHRIAGAGGDVGPDLSRIGQIRTKRDLAEAIIFPSATFARTFETYIVETDDGKVTSGVISRETEEAIFLRTTDRAEIRLARDAIEQIEPSKTSIMPQGLDKSLTPQELADLVAFLKNAK